jgi:hypothetical protein
VNNYWLQEIDKRKLRIDLERNFKGERYPEVSCDLAHEAFSNKSYHVSFSINLIVDDSDKIQEIQVL